MTTLKRCFFGVLLLLLVSCKTKTANPPPPVADAKSAGPSAVKTAAREPGAPAAPLVIRSADGKCTITIDTSAAPGMTAWAETKLAPALSEWYPKIVEMLPSDGFAPPTSFDVTFAPGRGVAATGGTRITGNSTWMETQITNQAVGSIVHEEVHVLQQYGAARRANPNAAQFPGWLTEGIADYIRFFKFEPNTHGADDVWLKQQNYARVRFDAAYRQTANFLNWVTENYDPDIVRKLNASARLGTYSEELWKAKSGKTSVELGREWKVAKAKQLGIDWTPPVGGEVQVTTAHNAEGTPAFRLRDVPAPARNDAAGRGTWTIVDGTRDEAGAGVDKLSDGQLPSEDDQPEQNFFFAAGSDGGRLQLDLGSATSIEQVNSYSWHTSTRAPQVYKLYASDGAAAGFQTAPKRGTDPEKCGWKLIASVDTRPRRGEAAGQYGVSVANSEGALGNYRYLLFDCSRTETDDDFGNTFYSEIDVVDGSTPAVAVGGEAAAAQSATKKFEAADGKYEFTIDASGAPDLLEWGDTELRPVVQAWYPKLLELLPSEAFEAPAHVTLLFRDNMPNGIPASAGGGRINLNIGWFRGNTKGEAKGAVVHEMVHIVQRYRRSAATTNSATGEVSAPTRFPGWLVEGIPDYIRWFKYEPESHGADDIWMKRQNFSRVRYDSSYRITANFLNWASEKYDKDLVVKLNASARKGVYSDDLWKTCTGKTAPELGEEWREQLRQKLGIAAEGGTSNTTTNKGT